VGLLRANSLGYAVATAQLALLVDRQDAEAPRLEVLALDTGERRPGEAHDAEADSFSHPANLLVASLAQGDLYPRLVALFVAQQPDLGGSRAAIFELDSIAPALQLSVGHVPGDLDDVDLGDAASRS
jgi:hypothetical protein